MRTITAQQSRPTTRQLHNLDRRRVKSPEVLLGNQRASLEASMFDSLLRTASFEPAAGFVTPPAGGTAAGWTGNRSWKLGLRATTGMGRRRVLTGGPV